MLLVLLNLGGFVGFVEVVEVGGDVIVDFVVIG